MIKKHVEVVAAVIIENNLIFCCQRGNYGECCLKWEFPGGKIEQSETNEKALVREIKEELDSLIEVKQFITKIDYEYETFSITIYAYQCNLIKGELTISEHIASTWVGLKDLSNLDFAAADLEIINYLVNNKN